MHLVAMIPFIAIGLCLRYPSLYVIGGENSSSDNQTELMRILMMPGFLLALRSLYDVQLVTPSDLIIPSIIGAVSFSLLIFMIVPSAKKRVFLFSLIVLVIIPYPIGAIAVFNSIYDDSEPTYYSPTVFYKESSSGKHASYDVYTEPVTLEGGHLITEFSLSRQVYEKTDVGDSICIVRRSGAFGISWYDVVSTNLCLIGSKNNSE
jgi:hypothetical protein